MRPIRSIFNITAFAIGITLAIILSPIYMIMVIVETAREPVDGASRNWREDVRGHYWFWQR